VLKNNTPERPTSEARRQATSNGQNTTSTTRPVAPPRVETVYATKLYVTIDGLKFRKGPSMDSSKYVIIKVT